MRSSPANALPEAPRSAPVAMAAPTTASPMPTQVNRDSRRPCANVIRPTHTGWVATSAVAVATVVSFVLGTQVMKCPANASPANTQNRASRRCAPSNARNSARRRSPAAGTSTGSAIALRQNAMANAGAAA